MPIETIMPKAKNNDIKDDPPLLIKGKGMPTTGRRPTTMHKLIIKFKKKWQKKILIVPSHT